MSNVVRLRKYTCQRHVTNFEYGWYQIQVRMHQQNLLTRMGREPARFQVHGSFIKMSTHSWGDIVNTLHAAHCFVLHIIAKPTNCTTEPRKRRIPKYRVILRIEQTRCDISFLCGKSLLNVSLECVFLLFSIATARRPGSTVFPNTAFSETPEGGYIL